AAWAADFQASVADSRAAALAGYSAPPAWAVLAASRGVGLATASDADSAASAGSVGPFGIPAFQSASASTIMIRGSTATRTTRQLTTADTRTRMHIHTRRAQRLHRITAIAMRIVRRLSSTRAFGTKMA